MAVRALLAHTMLVWSSVHVAVFLLLLYAIYSFGLFIYNVYFHPLAKFPGPRSYLASGIPAWWSMWRGFEHRDIKRLHDVYGSVVRVGPNSLSYITAQAWRDIYGHVQGRNQIPKDLDFYLPEGLNVTRSIINADDETHARMRKLVSHAFSAAALKEQEHILTKYFDLVVKRMREHVSESEQGIFDVTRWANYMTFDIIGDLAFGESFGMLETSRAHEYMTRVSKGSRHLVVLWTGQTFPVFGLLLDLYRRIPGSTDARRRQYQFAKERVDDRINLKTDRKDFLSYILRYNDERGMTPMEISNTSKTFLNAGSETTATAMPGVVYLMLRHPQVLEKATGEVRSRFKDSSEITLLSTSPKDLPYLFAVIEETLRVYPPISFNFPRRTVMETEIDGRLIPAGIRVGVHQYATYHSASNFRDPDSFVPERWLDNAQYAEDQKHAFHPFSTGARNCIGKNLAYTEITSMLARMLFHFDLELCPESNDWLDQRSYVMWEKGPLMVKLSLAKQTRQQDA